MKQDNAPAMKPYGRHLIICVDGNCAPPQEGERLQRRILELNRLQGLNKLSNPHRVKCSLSGCLGVCSKGPLLAVYPDGIWYHGVDLEAVERIYQEHVLQGRPVEDHIFHRLYPVGAALAYPPEMRGEGGIESACQPTHMPEEKPDFGAAVDENDLKSRQEYRKAVRRTHRRKGLIIVNTGNGKGKTTAAIGLMTRAWGRRMKVAVIQFLKNENARFGEILAGRRMGVDWISTGDGWTWTSRNMDETQSRALHAWEVARKRISQGGDDLLVLDEFTYPLHFGWLDVAETVQWLQANKPPQLHLIITGRYAPPQLIEVADLVTEMREVKHPFRQQGIRAQKGIEF